MLSLRNSWNEDVGLWTQDRRGHTLTTSRLARCHPASMSVSILLFAAETGNMEGLPSGRVFATLRSMQVLDESAHHGCVRWYWEDDGIHDDNSAFFTALGLIPLATKYLDLFSRQEQELLFKILTDLRIWFDHTVKEGLVYYPNKYLGDLVCAWCLYDILDIPERDQLIDTMLWASDYWLENHWGWGEHMSDIYSCVCMDELGLLLLSSELPDVLRGPYMKLFRDLLQIDDAYWGVRVPAIRNYSFSDSPTHVPYRTRIQPWSADAPVPGFSNHPHLHNYFHQSGWHDIAPPKREPSEAVTVPCFGDAQTEAVLFDDVRLGSISHFPFMESADHIKWGMSCQVFPVAFWRTEGDWGFLRWRSSEDRRVMGQPIEAMECIHSGEGKTNSLPIGVGRLLTQSVRPAISGHTWCIQQGPHLLALRLMPAVTLRWDWLSDSFDLLAHSAIVSGPEERENWSQLVLNYPERSVSLNYIDLTGHGLPQLKHISETEVRWELRQTEFQRVNVLGLWGISLEGRIEKSPIVRPAERMFTIPRTPEQLAWDIEWSWPRMDWRVHIDPLASIPISLTSRTESS